MRVGVIKWDMGSLNNTIALYISIISLMLVFYYIITIDEAFI